MRRIKESGEYRGKSMLQDFRNDLASLPGWSYKEDKGEIFTHKRSGWVIMFGKRRDNQIVSLTLKKEDGDAGFLLFLLPYNISSITSTYSGYQIILEGPGNPAIFLSGV